MNHLLEFTGALLYLVLSIVLFPLFALVQLLLWSVPAVKYAKASFRKFSRIQLKKRSYQLPHFLDLIYERVAKKHM